MTESSEEDYVSKHVVMRDPAAACYRVLVYARVWIEIASFRRLSDARKYFPKAQRRIGHINGVNHGTEPDQTTNVSQGFFHGGHSGAGHVGGQQVH